MHMSTVDYCSLSAKYAISMKSVRITESAKFSPMQTQKAFSTKTNTAGRYMFKVIKRKLHYTRKKIKLHKKIALQNYSKLTMKTERRQLTSFWYLYY